VLTLNFRRRWRTYVYGGMPRIFPSLCREMQVPCKRNIYEPMQKIISWWYISPPTFSCREKISTNHLE
jgi:hypothetical protein